MEEKATSTKQHLLDISRQLMMSKGYNATTVEEICKQASVTKGAFFYYFKSKEELGIATLKAYWELRQQQFADSGWMAEVSPLQKIQHFLATIADVFMSDPYGCNCLAGSFTQELADTNLMFRTLVSELFVQWADQIKPVLQEAKAQAGTSGELDIDLLADHIIVVVEGAIILALARQEPAIIGRQLAMLNTQLQVMFKSQG